MKHATEKMPIKGGKYDKVPENYTGTIYICPIHPEVRDVEKSDCPICSMFLQPEDEIDDASHMEHNHSENHHGHNHEHNHTHGHGTDTSNNEVNYVTGGKYDKVPDDYKSTVYTCPMHPEVRDVRNSGCPICGMAL